MVSTAGGEECGHGMYILNASACCGGGVNSLEITIREVQSIVANRCPRSQSKSVAYLGLCF